MELIIKYFGIKNGQYKKRDEYIYYEESNNEYYAIPSHSFGKNKWKPHISIAKLNYIKNFNKDDKEKNNELINNLLNDISKNLKNRPKWNHIIIGENTKVDFSM